MPNTILGSVLIDLIVGAGLGFGLVWIADNNFEDGTETQKLMKYLGKGLFFAIILYHIVARSINANIG